MLTRWQRTLEAITKKEQLQRELGIAKGRTEKLRNQIFTWTEYQKLKLGEPRLAKEVKRIDDELERAAKALAAIEQRISDATKAASVAQARKNEADGEFKAIMARFGDCRFPEFSSPQMPPGTAMPGTFEHAVDQFLVRQRRLGELDAAIREKQREVEGALGDDYIGADENETIRLLRDELEALPEREDVLRKEWEHQLHELRATPAPATW
jgi:hypothetical protein